MDAISDRGIELTLEDAPWVTELVERFKAAWQSGEPPDLDDFVRDAADRRAALVRLVPIDLEHRLQAGEAVSVQTYAARYPELADGQRLARQLIAGENRQRRPAPAAGLPEEYVQQLLRYAAEFRSQWPAPDKLLGIEEPNGESHSIRLKGLPKPELPAAETADHPDGPGELPPAPLPESPLPNQAPIPPASNGNGRSKKRIALPLTADDSNGFSPLPSKPARKPAWERPLSQPTEMPRPTRPLLVGLCVILAAVVVVLSGATWYCVRMQNERDAARAQLAEALQDIPWSNAPSPEREPGRPAGDFPPVPALIAQLTQADIQLSAFLEAYDQPRVSLDWHERALRSLGALLANVEQLPPETRHAVQHAYAKLQVHRTYAVARLGHHAQAASEAEILLHNSPVPPALYYHAACWYSLSSAAARNDPLLPAKERTDLARRYADRAMELLGQAKAVGYFSPAEVAYMDQDTDLNPVRARADFAQLAAQLPMKAKTDSKG
jgi:hypothetical protein